LLSIKAPEHDQPVGDLLLYHVLDRLLSEHILIEDSARTFVVRLSSVILNSLPRAKTILPVLPRRNTCCTYLPEINVKKSTGPGSVQSEIVIIRKYNTVSIIYSNSIRAN
jgi:hypothetical protein